MRVWSRKGSGPDRARAPRADGHDRAGHAGAELDRAGDDVHIRLAAAQYGRRGALCRRARRPGDRCARPGERARRARRRRRRRALVQRAAAHAGRVRAPARAERALPHGAPAFHGAHMPLGASRMCSLCAQKFAKVIFKLYEKAVGSSPASHLRAHSHLSAVVQTPSSHLSSVCQPSATSGHPRRHGSAHAVCDRNDVRMFALGCLTGRDSSPLPTLPLP